MWHEYFDKSQVRGIDITDAPDGFPDLRRLMDSMPSRMIIDIMDARNTAEVMHHIGDADCSAFDIIIEDASHDLFDSIDIYNNFIKRLNPGGLYIIEDIADIDCTRRVLGTFIKSPRRFEVLDFRAKKHRFDDVLITIQ